ncbi:MAG: divergent polysaccharide deacetylase family protein [Elusimicrobiota bacterium]
MGHKGFIKTLLLVFFVIVIAMLFLIIRESGDYTNLAVEIDAKISKILTKYGVRESDLIQKYWQEKKNKNFKWLEIIREIDFRDNPRAGEFPRIKSEILDKARKSGLKVNEIKSKGEKLTLEFYKSKKLLLKLVFRLRTIIRVALVMDDLGYDATAIHNYLALDIPITYSVLPKEKYTKELVGILSRAGALYLLHQPMEPEHMENKKNYPGKAALLLRMSDEENVKMLQENLKWVKGACGINNHMGSEFTQHPDRMKPVIMELKEKGLIFFDSTTSKKSVGKKVADDLGVPSSYNNVFLDIEDDYEIIRKQFMTLLVLARKKGHAAGICHITKKNLLQNLKEMIPVYRQNGVEFVDLKEYIEER